jgi:hypothetical protein
MDEAIRRIIIEQMFYFPIVILQVFAPWRKHPKQFSPLFPPHLTRGGEASSLVQNQRLINKKSA